MKKVTALLLCLVSVCVATESLLGRSEVKGPAPSNFGGVMQTKQASFKKVDELSKSEEVQSEKLVDQGKKINELEERLLKEESRAAKKGERGAPGLNGKDGVGSKGERGAPGPAGRVGGKGAKGDRGPAGGVGNTGKQGRPGSVGGKGAKGDRGPAGGVGGKGAKGDRGPAGGVGNTGKQGLQGPPGKPGPQGPPGTSKGTVRTFTTYGRPYRVNGELISAPLTCQANNSKRIKAWKESAIGEHASVASFADLSLKLFAVGAPLNLLEKAASAQLDEVRHAELMLNLIKKVDSSDQELEFGAVNLQNQTTSVFDTTHTKLMLESLEDGCINEGIAARLASEIAKDSTDLHVRNTYETIANDELRHASLAWNIVEWVLSVKPELADTAKKYYNKYEEAAKTIRATSFPGTKLTTEEAFTRAVSLTLQSNRERLSVILKKIVTV